MHLLTPSDNKINVFWVAESVIDSARLLGLPTYRNRVSTAVFNPELVLRDASKDDRPIPRRLQFVQNFVKRNINSSTR